MDRFSPWIASWIVVLGIAAVIAHGETFVWVDEKGVTHITDDRERVPQGAAATGRLEDVWQNAVDDRAGRTASTPLDREAARKERLIRGAVDDLNRGETARASVALEDVLRQAPGDPHAHWYLALLDRQRGRYQSARVHLEAFLAAAGDDLQAWRLSAERRLAALDDEARLADLDAGAGDRPWRDLTNEHFHVVYDPDLGQASPDYAKTVLRYLNEARATVLERLGTVPREAMGVVFYGKAAYLRAHRHRFSFQTIGFFDGRIHVVSAAHPAGELRSLLFHEYSHAVYREQTGSDRPYWLNEGLAELSERAAVGRDRLTRSERRSLHRRIHADEWLPLARLAPSFAGLDDDGARAAYLESTAAAAWIAARTNREQRHELLTRLAEGVSADAALRQVLGVDTAGLDSAVRESIRAEFPSERELVRNELTEAEAGEVPNAREPGAKRLP